MKKYIIPIALFCCSQDVLALNGASSLLGLGLGYTEYLHRPSQQFDVSDYITDTLHGAHQHHDPSYNISYKFLIPCMNNHIMDAVFLGPAIYYQQTRFKGEIWELGLPLFNNYHYTFTNKNISAYLEGDIYFQSILHVSPFVTAGLGVVSAKVKYHDSANPGIPTDSELQLNTHKNHNLAYELGAGLALPINSHWQIVARYLYQNLGTVYSSHHSVNHASMAEPVAMNINNNSLILGINYAY